MNERRKVWKENNWFDIENETEDGGQSIPKSLGNVEILTSISSDLLRGQTHKLKMG